jgi:hypothetical protein
MKVVTIASDLEHPFLRRFLISSCSTLGLKLVVLHCVKDGWQHSDKRSILKNYLSQSPESDELVLFTDAYDTVFVRGEQHIRDLYTTFPQSVVFSAEPNSWPMGSLGLAIQDALPPGPYPFLNSGGFIGPASDVLALYNKYPTPPSERFDLLQKLRRFNYDPDERYVFSDQYYWTLVQLVEGDTVALDNSARIFENLTPRVLDVWDLYYLFDHFEFGTRGKEAASYGRERERLEGALRSPSDAAHIHFSNPISKAVVLDLLDEGRLPDWLGHVAGSPLPNLPGVEVVTADHLVDN